MQVYFSSEIVTRRKINVNSDFCATIYCFFFLTFVHTSLSIKIQKLLATVIKYIMLYNTQYFSSSILREIITERVEKTYIGFNPRIFRSFFLCFTLSHSLFVHLFLPSLIFSSVSFYLVLRYTSIYQLRSHDTSAVCLLE